MVRIFPYPILEEGNLSFPEGKYEVVMEPDGDSLRVKHVVEGAPFIERLVSEKKAICACTVSVPKASYRRIYKGAGFHQIVKLDQEWLAEPPILRPIVVCCEPVEHKLSKADGVNDVWIGQRVSLGKGAKIALGSAFRPTSSMQALLSVEKDDELESGQIAVEICSEDGFYFRTKVAADLYNFIQKPGSETFALHRQSMLIHAVSCCFALLAKDYGNDGEGEDGWRSHTNLKALAADMESKGLDMWNTEEFIPERVATEMWPHPVPERSDESI